MTFTSQQLREMGYDPSQPGSVLQRTPQGGQIQHPEADSTHFDDQNGTEPQPPPSKCVQGRPSVFWVDYQIKSLNRTRYQHWTVARKSVVAALQAWERAMESSNTTLPFADVSVSIISVRSKLLDGDNLQAGGKGIRDAIAKSLGIDDADKFIKWHYHQIQAKPYGTLVLIS